MILSDRDIEKYMGSKIKIDPIPDLEIQLGSCLLDFRLGCVFRIFEPHSGISVIDPEDKIDLDDVMRRIEVGDGEAFTMQPGEFVLAGTKEKLELSDDMMGRLEGRSSLGRLGIIVHSTAGVFDPGYIGNPTLELGNLGKMPVVLRPGMRICAFTFELLSSPVKVPYNRKPSNKYSGQFEPNPSRIGEESN
tara:strand:- start:33 stop:605 length:573 start_codon:yes stop_codon:yes gene_type:complete